MDVGYQRGKRGRKPKFVTEEERRAARVQWSMKWNRANKDKVAVYKKNYYEKHREKILQKAREYYRAKVGLRAAEVEKA